MQTDELRKEIHELIVDIFKKAKKGYCWVDAKFGKNKSLTDEELRDVRECLHSKRDQLTCPIHSRTHAKR